MKETELAKSLLERDMSSRMDPIIAFKMNGVSLAPYYHHTYAGMPTYSMSDVIYENLQSESAIHRALSKTSKNFLKRAEALRKRNGINYGIDAYTSIFHLIAEVPEAQKKLGEFDRLPNGEPDFRDKDKYITMFEKAVDDPDLRKKLLARISVEIPDAQNDKVINSESVIGALESMGIYDGTLLELGCGSGTSTIDLALSSRMSVVGLDRQYHPTWYRPNWTAIGLDTHFLRADFAKGIPVTDNSCSGAVLKYVINYMTEDALAKGLKEVERVLDRGKILVVGPQLESPDSLRLFTKNQNLELEEL